jgi:hypothetical protein
MLQIRMKMGFVLGICFQIALTNVFAEDKQITIKVAPQEVDIIRETPNGDEVMIYLQTKSLNTETLVGFSLEIETKKGWMSRKLLDIEPTMRYDFLWLKKPLKPAYKARLKDAKGNVLLETILAITPASRTSVIPMSKVIKISQVPNLILRGTNYYPQLTPWNGMWTKTTMEVFKKEFETMRDKLNVNAVRTFYIADKENNYEDKTLRPSTIEKANQLYQIGDDHKIHFLMCLYGGGRGILENTNNAKRFMRSAVEPFIYDGRIIAWDLINEPGGSDGPKKSPYHTWIPIMYDFISKVDTIHELQIGLCWQFNQLKEVLGFYPSVGQYHHYSHAVGIPNQKSKYPDKIVENRPVGKELYATCKSVGRPIIIGEFGSTSSTLTGMSENIQAEIYKGIFEGSEYAVAQGARVPGIFNWAAFVFTNLKDDAEKHFGTIDTDGRVKENGIILKEYYDKWMKKYGKAPWELRNKADY